MRNITLSMEQFCAYKPAKFMHVAYKRRAAKPSKILYIYIKTETKKKETKNDGIQFPLTAILAEIIISISLDIYK